MKRAWGLLTTFLLLALVANSAWAGSHRPIVAVFDVEQASKVKLEAETLEEMAKYLSTRLTESGKYQVIPRDQLKKRLFAQKAQSLKECYDQSCQIEIGKELAAEKTLSARIAKLGGRCTVSLTLYDLRIAATEKAASQHGRCGEGEIMNSLDKTLAKLFNDKKTRAAEAPIAAAEKTDYEIELELAWRKLRRVAHAGTDDQKLARYQTFLTDFPDQNPYKDQVLKTANALEAALDNKATAHRQSVELEAKRKRNRQMREAFKRAQKTSGTHAKKIAALEGFLNDYPGDNPYRKSAQRKITNLRTEEQLRLQTMRAHHAVAKGTHVVFDTYKDNKAPYLALKDGPWPGSGARVVAKLKDGTQLVVLSRKHGKRGRWWKVRIVSGTHHDKVGFAHSSWLKRSP